MFPHFGWHGNGGWSERNFTNTVKFDRTQNPVWCKNWGATMMATNHDGHKQRPWWPQTMTTMATTMMTINHDDQWHNSVKFVQQCQMSLTVVMRLYNIAGNCLLTCKTVSHMTYIVLVETLNLTLSYPSQHGLQSIHSLMFAADWLDPAPPPTCC